MSELASYELDGRIATITMDDGKVNVLSIPMLQALHAAFDRAEEDNAVVLLTGREGYFSAGFDLKVFTEHPEQIVEMLTLGATLAERVLAFPTRWSPPAADTQLRPGLFCNCPPTYASAPTGPFNWG